MPAFYVRYDSGAWLARNAERVYVVGNPACAAEFTTSRAAQLAAIELGDSMYTVRTYSPHWLQVLTRRYAVAYDRAAIRWASARWFLEEQEQVREWCERSRDLFADPTELVDAYADKYDLTDYCGPFQAPMPDRSRFQPNTGG